MNGNEFSHLIDVDKIKNMQNMIFDVVVHRTNVNFTHDLNICVFA